VVATFPIEKFLGEIMKSKTIQKVLFPIVFTILFGSSFTCGINAESMAKKQTVLLDVFHANNDVTCADCHGDDEQRKVVPMIKCKECHDTTELAEKTAHGKPTNPHKNRHYSTEADCNLCHHQHKKSNNFCLPCHNRFDFIVP
jgi:hypothetical protein